MRCSRYIAGICVITSLLASAPMQRVDAAVAPKAIYANVTSLPGVLAPGQSANVHVRIDRKGIPQTWLRVRVAPTPGVLITSLPTWTKGKELNFRVVISKKAKQGAARINLSLTQSGLTARLPLVFTITNQTVAPIPVATPTISVPVKTPTTACPIFPADNAWNQDISKALTHWNSDAYMSAIGLTRSLHPDFGQNQEYGIPVTIASADSRDVPIRFTDYGDESDPGPYPIPASATIEAGSDAHVIVFHPTRCKLYELYAAAKEGSGWSAASGAIFDLKSNGLRPAGWTSADAAGLPIYPGLVKYEEVAAGKITHAIRFTAPRTQNGYIHPATHFAGSADSSLPPMGLRVRLKSNYDLSKLTGQAKVIAQAMKTYGLILADNGSPWFFQGATDSRWNDDELNQLKAIPGSAFEAVETGAILH